MKLNQALAIEKSAKTAANSKGTELLKLNKQTALYNGMQKTFKPREEDDARPNENQVVQNNAKANLAQFRALFEDLWDATLTKDVGNQSAVASVTVDGLTTEPLPVTYLIWLEKQLNDVKLFVSSLPLLDPAKEWCVERNPQTDLFETKAIETASTKKRAVVLTLAPATEHHQAQAQVAHEDVIAGVWSTKHLSGAVPKTYVDGILAKADKLLRAVKTAREEANSNKVDQKKIGEQLFSYLLG